MAHQAYMTIKGDQQGFISENCSHQNSIGNQSQAEHIDQIMVLAFNHELIHTGATKFAYFGPIQISKYLDKSSPLLAAALVNNEVLECTLDFYRAASTGREKFYSIELSGAVVAAVTPNMDHVALSNDRYMEENLVLRYRKITWTHHVAGTTAEAQWGVSNR